MYNIPAAELTTQLYTKFLHTQPFGEAVHKAVLIPVANRHYVTLGTP